MLCADCDNATAARRAEQIRKSLSQIAAAEDGRPIGHGQLRRHRNPAGRHAGNDASPRRPGTADGQGQRAQHRRAARQRNRRRTKCRTAQPAARFSPRQGSRTSSNRTWSRPCRSRSPSKSCGASWPIIRRESSPSTATSAVGDRGPADQPLSPADRSPGHVLDRPAVRGRASQERTRPGVSRRAAADPLDWRIKVAIGPRTQPRWAPEGNGGQGKGGLGRFRSYLMAIEEETPAEGTMTSVKRISAPG